MNPTNENPTPIDCASPQPKGYQPPQVLLELTLECQAGSALSLPDLEGEIDAVP
jgi:hypothetical protein